MRHFGEANALPMHLPPKRVYHVPRRFNILSILILMTVFAVGLAILRWAESPLFLYLFLGIQASLTFGAQMIWPGSPRNASIVTGVILLPLTFVGHALRSGPQGVDMVQSGMFLSCVGPFLLIAGGFVGYALGVFAAGVFLIADKLDSLLTRKPAATLGHSPFASGSPVAPGAESTGAVPIMNGDAMTENDDRDPVTAEIVLDASVVRPAEGNGKRPVN